MCSQVDNSVREREAQNIFVLFCVYNKRCVIVVICGIQTEQRPRVVLLVCPNETLVQFFGVLF